MRPMKFWELVSSFREEPWAVLEVVSRPEWQEPYRRWLGAYNQLIDREDREVLDALVPEALSREVARLCSRRFAYSPLWGVVRESWPEGGRNPGPLEDLSALEVHDRFGGWVIEEIGEFGSMSVGPSQIEDVDEPSPPEPPAPPPQPPRPPRPEPTRADLEAEIRVLQPRLDANPRDHNARLELANALIRMDRPKEAIPHLLVVADFFWNDGFRTVARGYLRMASRGDAGHADVVARQKEWGV
jgi:hypothetical protein